MIVGQTLNDIAATFGVELITVKQWRRLGLPGPDAQGNWPLGPIIDWLYTQGPRRPKTTDDIDTQKKLAEAKKKTAEAEMAELKLQEIQGLKIDASQVAEQMGDVFEALRGALNTLEAEYGGGARQLMLDPLDDVERNWEARSVGSSNGNADEDTEGEPDPSTE